MSTSTDHLVAVNAPMERRFYPRVTPSAPIYVAFGSNNLGTLLNVSENGFQVVTPSRLDHNSVYRVFLSLNGVSSAITVTVRTIWTADSQRTSGIQLLDLTDHDRQQIRKWVELQTSLNEGNENLEHWFTPKASERSTARLDSEPPPAVAEPVVESLDEPVAAPIPTEPAPTEPPPNREFAPMPLPIHGEFTYQPPSPEEEKLLRRRERASRASNHSPFLSTVFLWTLVLAICLAAGWSFRSQLSEIFLRRFTQVAKVSPEPADSATSPIATDATEPPAPSERSTRASVNNDTQDAGQESGHAANSPLGVTPPAATSDLPPRNPATAKRPTVSPSKPNLNSLPTNPVQAEAPEVSHPYVADSAPQLTANNDASVAKAPNPVAVPAPLASSSSVSAPKSTTAPPPSPATVRPSTEAPASRRSAIAGSISNDSRSNSDPSARPSDTFASSTPASPENITPRATSFVPRNANSGNPATANPASAAPAAANAAIIQMDAPEARVIEVTPPRSLTGNLTASFVTLPGERVLRSGPITMHIERSVKVPGDRIPGERWLWRGHRKVVLGELTSRVDPQVSQLAAPYGSIAVLAVVDKDGNVTDVKPLYGSLSFLPNVAAAVRNWRYQPTYIDNKPADTQAQIEIDFHPPTARASKP